MKKVLTSAILLALTATAANAASLNLRHEYVPESGDMKSAHKDRLLMDHRFANGIGISAEVKWGYNSDGLDFDNMKSGGHETKVSYNYKLTDTFTLQPAYALDSNSTAITHKLDLKATQKLSDDWSVDLRYRYGYKNNAESSIDSHYNQLNLTSGYKMGDFKYGLDIEYKFEQSNSKGYDGDNQYLSLVNLSAEYSGLESGWRPFGEFGMVAQNTDNNADGKDSFEPRFRVGVKYSF